MKNPRIEATSTISPRLNPSQTNSASARTIRMSRIIRGYYRRTSAVSSRRIAGGWSYRNGRGRKQKMRLVILGCGRVGSTLAMNMDKAGHQVTVIDRNSDAFRRLGVDFKGETLVG